MGVSRENVIVQFVFRSQSHPEPLHLNKLTTAVQQLFVPSPAADVRRLLDRDMTVFCYVCEKTLKEDEKNGKKTGKKKKLNRF